MVLSDLSRLPLLERRHALLTASQTKWTSWKGLVERDPHITFFAGEVTATALLDRLRTAFPTLRTVLQGDIQRGVSPDIAAAHVITKEEAKAAALEAEILRPSISGSQIRRYHEWHSDQQIIYTGRTTPMKNYPHVLEHLQKFRHLNKCVEVKEGKHPWWSLHRPRDPQIFASPKVIGLTTSKTIHLAYDADTSLYVTDAMYVFSFLPQYEPLAYMAILQSKLFLFLYRVTNQGESRVIPQIKASKLQLLPCPVCDSSTRVSVRLRQCHEDMVTLNKRRIAAETNQDRSIYQRQIDALDREIDQLVYQLYGLSADDIAMVEAEAR